MSAGYSGTPLARKLGIKAGHRVLLIQAPPELEALLDPLPEAVTLMRTADDDAYDVVLLFCEWLTDLTERFPVAAGRLVPAGGAWACWPKKASKRPTDLDGNIVRHFGLSTGLVDNKVCAIDATWSALRFVMRLENRPRN